MKKEVINLKKSQEGSLREFKRRKGKEKLHNYNLKIKINNFKNKTL